MIVVGGIHVAGVINVVGVTVRAKGSTSKGEKTLG